MAFEIITFPGDRELAEAAASRWLDVLAARADGTRYSVALSGGRIAHDFFSEVTRVGIQRGTSFAGVHFFWADERCVPPNDPDSNFRVASELMFAPLNIPSEQIHRLRGEAAEAEALRDAVENLMSVAPVNAAGQPVLDMVFLGMGEEGHVASLFPGELEAVSGSPEVYRAVTTPKPPPRRITLGYPALAAAREVWMMASGKGKEAALRASISPEGATPFGRVLKLRQRTKILTDIELGFA